MRPVILVILAALATACSYNVRSRPKLGWTREEVENALGRPDQRYERASEKDNLEIWAYSIYSRAFDVTSEKIVGAPPKDALGGGIRDDERVRVVFRDGKVVFFESRQP